MILWPLPCPMLERSKGCHNEGIMRSLAGGDKEAPQGYYIYEGNLMIYNACTWYVT